jgi:hypothetical protein
LYFFFWKKDNGKLLNASTKKKQIKRREKKESKIINIIAVKVRVSLPVRRHKFLVRPRGGRVIKNRKKKPTKRCKKSLASSSSQLAREEDSKPERPRADCQETLFAHLMTGRLLGRVNLKLSCDGSVTYFSAFCLRRRRPEAGKRKRLSRPIAV